MARVFDAALAGGGAKRPTSKSRGGPRRDHLQVPLPHTAVLCIDHPGDLGPPAASLSWATLSTRLSTRPTRYISKRLLTDDSPRLRAALRYMVYGRAESLQTSKSMIDLLQALETFPPCADGGMGPPSRWTACASTVVGQADSLGVNLDAEGGKAAGHLTAYRAEVNGGASPSPPTAASTSSAAGWRDLAEEGATSSSRLRSRARDLQYLLLERRRRSSAVCYARRGRASAADALSREALTSSSARHRAAAPPLPRVAPLSKQMASPPWRRPSPRRIKRSSTASSGSRRSSWGPQTTRRAAAAAQRRARPPRPSHQPVAPSLARAAAGRLAKRRQLRALLPVLRLRTSARCARSRRRLWGG